MENGFPAVQPLSSPIRSPEATGRLAALRALQRAIDSENREVEQVAQEREQGLGQNVDIRC